MSFASALEQFLANLANPQHRFADTLKFIDDWFVYSPSTFSFHQLHSQANENQGSCKILALAQFAQLTPQQALLCFGEHYRQLPQLPLDSHLNLRQLAKQGLTQIQFAHFPLQLKEE